MDLTHDQNRVLTVPSDKTVDKPCPGAGKSWTVDIAGKPICPRCRRALSTVAGKGRSLRDSPRVPPHNRPGRHNQKPPRKSP